MHYTLKTKRLLLLIACIFLLFIECAGAEQTSIRQSVERTLNNNPQIEAYRQKQKAARFELQQKKGAYLPSVDLFAGYGLDQHSDDVTRRVDADPTDNDWDERGEATLKLTQKIYDGNETGSQVSIQKALLESADLQLRAADQSMALNAITAHLNVLKQRELASLAEQNLTTHLEIKQLLEEREQAGTGSIADVTQVQSRLSRAESTLYLVKSDLSRAEANYVRIVGTFPADLAFAGIPEGLPQSLDAALLTMVQDNPELKILDAEISEAKSRIALSHSKYKPKIELELSSRYTDQLEGDSTWQNTNVAMLNLNWNLFNGGQDKAEKNANSSRAAQVHSQRTDKLSELSEAMTTSWSNFHALKRQKSAYLDAVDYSKRTLEAYLKQFSVSQRSLLDLLSAENDYYQSAMQLISIEFNEVIAAHQIMAISGHLSPSSCSGHCKDHEYFTQLKNRLKLPPITTFFSTPNGTVPSSGVNNAVEEDIDLFVNGWAEAWQSQDLASYLRYYSDDFVPQNDLTDEEWQSLRAKRLAAPAYIHLYIEGIETRKESDSRYFATFSQSYRSNLYSDKVRKTLTLVRNNGSWSIVEEIAEPVMSSPPLNLTSY